jgi:CBS domain-containing protein
MTRHPSHIDPKETVDAASHVMEREGVGSLLVVDDGLTGIITERDIVTKVVSLDRKASNILVEEIMTAGEDVTTIEPQRDLYDAMNLMRDNQVRRLPVVDRDESLQGIITGKDVLRVESSLIDLVKSGLNIREEKRKLGR